MYIIGMYIAICIGIIQPCTNLYTLYVYSQGIKSRGDEVDTPPPPQCWASIIPPPPPPPNNPYPPQK